MRAVPAHDDDSEAVGSLSSSDLSSHDDDSSSGDGSSSSGSDVTEETNGELGLARTEANFVLCSKFLAYTVLFLSAVAAGFAAYYFTRDQETSDFEHDVSATKDCQQVPLCDVSVPDYRTLILTTVFSWECSVRSLCSRYCQYGASCSG